MNKAMNTLRATVPSARLKLNGIPAHPRPDFRNMCNSEHYNSMPCGPFFP